MPSRPAQVCTHPGCGVLVHDGSGRCQAHPRKAWARVKPTKRIRGRKLQALRHHLFEHNPLCAECVRRGTLPIRLATIRDHIVNLEEGGADDESNTQGLCEPCHDLKTQAERERGIGRARGGIPTF